MTLRRTFLTLVACSALLGVAPGALAAPSAQDFIKAKQNELMGLIKAGKPDAEVDKVFNQVLDYQVLAEASLGQHWAGRTDEERKEFVKLLSTLVRNSYRKNLKKTLGYTVTYNGTEQGESGEVVHTKATSTHNNNGEEPLSIDYVVRSTPDGQRIVDVVTEGSSMVHNYRSSFNRAMKKGGFAEVLKRMRNKVASGSTSAGD